LHVIAGDANMMPSCTARKVGLIKIALSLAMIDESPVWEISDPVHALREISRDETREYRVELRGKNWTTAYDILDSYLCAYDSLLSEDDGDPELRHVIHESQMLMEALRERQDVTSKIDWAAKEYLLAQYVESEGVRWDDAALKSFDLEYSNVDPNEGLYWALIEAGIAEAPPANDEVIERLVDVFEPTRALARGVAVRNFRDRLIGASWASLTFRGGEDPIEVYLPPDREYSLELQTAESVERFIDILRGA
jgi:proteasome accessory factor A